mgnify:CR=1 FL=1
MPGLRFPDGESRGSQLPGLRRSFFDDLQPVSQTLFIPLRVRAEEASRPIPLFSDEKAKEILAASDTEGIVSDGGAVSRHGIPARTHVMDQAVQKLLAENPRSTVINLGAGLNTRMSRASGSPVRWKLPRALFRRCTKAGCSCVKQTHSRWKRRCICCWTG